MFYDVARELFARVPNLRTVPTKTVGEGLAPPAYPTYEPFLHKTFVFHKLIIHRGAFPAANSEKGIYKNASTT